MTKIKIEKEAIKGRKIVAISNIKKDEIVITAEQADKNTQQTQMGVMSMPVEKIKQLPQFMGEVDILRMIQLLPGVKNAGEGNTGFYVRGGGPDQNLILLDEAVVYNASHLFGFFSVFNADAVKNMLALIYFKWLNRMRMMADD